MFELISYLVFTTAIATIVVLYYAYLLTFRLSRKIFFCIPITIMVALSAAISGFSNQNKVLNFFLNFIILLLVLCFFKSTIREILYALTLEVLTLISDGFSYYIFCLIFGDEAVRKNPIIAVSGQLTNILLLAILAYFAAKKLKSIQQLDIPKSYWILLLITPTGSIVLSYFIYGFYYEAQIMLVETFISVLVLFVMIVGATFVYGNTVDYFNVKLRNQTLSSQLDVFSEKQNNLTKMSRETRRVQHDLKNRLIPVLLALGDGEYQNAQDSLSRVLGEISNVQEIAYTGIEYVDDMINYKAGIAKKYGIRFHVKNEMEPCPHIPFMDISAAIGIALDNAIEACQKKNAQKDVYIDFIYRMGVFYIRIENSLVGELQKNNFGDIMTTKSDAENHGFGIQSIQNLINKHGGDVKIEVKDGQFILSIMFWRPQ